MKKNPVDGGRYRKSVKDAKEKGRQIARKAEALFHLPRGSVRIYITKMSASQRDKLAARVA